MKRKTFLCFWIVTCLVVFLGLSVVPCARAEELTEEYTTLDKLGRGALNIVTCPVEVARQINNRSNEKGAGYGWTIGLIEGLGRGVARLGVGLVEVVTCPFDFPGDDKSPIFEPEHPWEDWTE